MKFCTRCGSPVIGKDGAVYKDLYFCSAKCLDTHFLTKCKLGEISFLDMPQEVRDRERGKKALACKAKRCPICGAMFYPTSSFGEYNRKCCSKLCAKVAIRRSSKKNWWKNVGWMSPQWRGGISNEVYCHKFNESLKHRVRVFFEEKCFLCGKSQKDNQKKLSVHHVNYNKNACCDSSKVMLVPLCDICHGKTNNDREYWEDYFEKILREKYNYKCYYTKEEYKNLGKRVYPPEVVDSNPVKKVPRYMKWHTKRQEEGNPPNFSSWVN